MIRYSRSCFIDIIHNSTANVHVILELLIVNCAQFSMPQRSGWTPWAASPAPAGQAPRRGSRRAVSQPSACARVGHSAFPGGRTASP